MARVGFRLYAEGQRSFGCRLLILGLFIALALYGCAQKTLPTAVKLSRAGQDATSTMKSAATLTDDQLDAIHRYIIFHDAFNDDGTDSYNVIHKGNEKIISDIDELQKLIVANTEWLSSLQKAYIALGELAGYDASASFITAYNNLNTSTNNLFTAFGSSQPSNTAADGLKYLGGQAIGFVQSRKVITASKAIHGQLDKAVELLSSDVVKNQYTMLQAQYMVAVKRAVLILFANNVMSATPIVEDIGLIAKLKAAKDSDKIIKNNKRLQAAITAIIIEACKQQIKKIEKIYDKSLEALTALQKQHGKLEQSADIDLNNLTSIVSQLQGLTSTSSK